jgi:hypothetical protein
LLADEAIPLGMFIAPAPGGNGMTTSRERAELKRQEKLANVQEAVESGSLVIRQMTDEERRRDPPRPVAPKRPRPR